MKKQLQSAHRILNTAVTTYKPSLIVLSYSGGYDSMVSSHVAYQWSRLYAHSANLIVVSADTGISADGWTEYVTSSARDIGIRPFYLKKTDHMKKWAERILESGFPFRESQHRINFYYLKQVVFRGIIRENKKHRHDHIMFVNGVRRAESNNRINRPEIAKQGSGLFVNAILHWSDEDVQRYRMMHDMPTNPFYDRFGNSGDCLCNFHIRFSLDDLRKHGRKALEIIEPLHHQCKAQHGYGYGETAINGWFQGTPQMLLPGFEETPNLCTDCHKPSASNEAIDDVMMQRFEW